MHRPQLQSRAESFFAGMDYWLLIPVVLITLIGLVVMNKVLLAGYGSGSWPSNFIKQVGAVLVGLLLSLLVCLIEAPTLRLLGWGIYGLSILLLIYEKIDGFTLAELTGADSWIRLPFIGSFQPSEMAKIGLAITGSLFFARLKEGTTTLWQGFFSLAALYGVPLFLILREPDFGTSIVIIFMLAVCLFVYGLKWRYILGIFGLLIAAVPLLWNFFFSAYMKRRILTVLFPGQEMSERYHLDQAIKAMSSGGLAGNRSGVDVHVPVKESDFIYSAVGEYLGLIGSASLVILVIIFLVRGTYVAWQISQADSEYSFMMMALIANMSFHFIEAMGNNVGLLPVTGIPLPFVSNGGTSMVMNYIALGLLLNGSMNLKIYQS